MSRARGVRHPLSGQHVRLSTDNRTQPTIGLVLMGLRFDRTQVLVAWGDQQHLTPKDRRPAVEYARNLTVVEDVPALMAPTIETWPVDAAGRLL